MQVPPVAIRVLVLGTMAWVAAAATPAVARNKGQAEPAAKPAHVAGGVKSAAHVPAPLAAPMFRSAAFRFAQPLLAAGRGRYEVSLRGARVPFGNGVYYGVSRHSMSKTGKMRFGTRTYAYRYGNGEEDLDGSLQCVPFARAASGIELKGNAANWWNAAAGIYERGSRPEPGSVLNFRSTGHMRLGHVAVVTAVLGAREVEIDHANWAGAGALKGGVARGVHVIDVSDENDWSAVRVALPDSDEFGSVYPTYGFIYDRPDTGVMASNADRQVGYRLRTSEVAEAPERSSAR